MDARKPMPTILPTALHSANPSCNAVVGNDTICLLNAVTEPSSIWGNKFSTKWSW